MKTIVAAITLLLFLTFYALSPALLAQNARAAAFGAAALERSDGAAPMRADDTPGITVAPVAGLVTSEYGDTDTFTVVLNTQPSAPVSLNLFSSDDSEGTVSPGSLTFTPGNWSIAQTVTVIGQDDNQPDGRQRYTIITSTASSADPQYDRLNPANVTVHNHDNDTPGFIIRPASGLLTSEDGGMAQFTVTLQMAPLLNVSIALASSDPTEGLVDPASLTFTPGNWSVPRTVTVTGVDDGLEDGDVPYQVVTAPAQSLDDSYSGIDPIDVDVTNLDNEPTALLAVGDQYATQEDALLEVPAPGVLANDTYPANSAALVELVSDVSNGILVFHSDGSFIYTPEQDFYGQDSFVYHILDGELVSNPASVTITVSPINDAPLAFSDRYDTNATPQQPLVVAPPGVLGNDTDPDLEGALTAVLFVPPSSGDLTLNPDGSFTYRPDRLFEGQDTFSYQATDGELYSDAVEVLIVSDHLPPNPVHWISPVGDGEIHRVRGETVSLQVIPDPQDHDINRIWFYRWDPSTDSYVDLGNIHASPYTVSLDTYQLSFGWNQIFARAYDQAGNSSERQFIWLILEYPLTMFLPFVAK